LSAGGATGLDLPLLALVSLVAFADFTTLSSRRHAAFIRGGGSPLPTIYNPSFIVFHITGIIVCATWFAQCILYNTYG